MASYADSCWGHFKHPKQAAYCGAYLQGLLLDGERKSIDPMARRVHLPDGVKVADLDQALQQFLGQSPWDESAVMASYRSTMPWRFASPRDIFIADDTGLPKQGQDSVGVSRQYCGALGEQANCQVAPSLHYVGPDGHFPLAMRLYLPKTWVGDAQRLDRAGVPDQARSLRTKGQIVLELLDEVRAEGLAGQVVNADAGYGVSGPFRDGLAERGLYYIVGVTEEMVVFQTKPVWDAPTAGEPGRKGRPATRSKLADDSPRPMSLKGLAAKLPRCKVTWREGTEGRMSARFAWVRVWPAGGWATGECKGATPTWLLIEEQADGAIRYAVSNLPTRTSRIKAVRLWKTRWRVEQGYQQMKEELGLDHHEGRSWRGFHHHACLVMLTFGFLALDRDREERNPACPGEKGGRRPVITLPAIRRALQRLLAPLCRHDCPYCKGQCHALRAVLTE